MKTITFNQKKNSVLFRWGFLCLFGFSLSNGLAQVQNNEPLYIGDTGSVYLESGSYYFGGGNGQTITTRSANNYGKLIFSSGATTSGASDSHYLDGYGSVRTVLPFVLPVGQAGVYAPLQITPQTINPVDAAYFRSDAGNIGIALDNSVGLISGVEYWNVQGSNSASITLSWRASSFISNLVLSVSDLIIVGFDGTKWVEIPCTVDANSLTGGNSTMTSGSITTNSAVDLSMFSYFTFGATSRSCAPLVASSGITKSWNGSWTPSAPTLADSVVINAPYSDGSFVCNSLELNDNVTLSDGQDIEIVNGVTGSGKIIMTSEASVVQRASNVGTPTIQLTKKTRDAMHQYDYVYWGTPIAGDFFSQLANAKASTAPSAGAFDLKYKWVSGTGGGWVSLTAVETGKGYITRVAPFAPFTNATTTDFINLTFNGVANNGDISVPITNNPSSPNGSTSHMLLANPYPSAIDADKFLTSNTEVDGVVYIWTSATLNAGNSQAYSQADYIAYTLAGTVIPNDITPSFTGKIASGQGFEVKSLTNAGSVTFTNCMRLTDNNDQFFKHNIVNAVVGEKDRYKLNMRGANGVFSQILVSYIPQATMNYDRMYDAGRNSVSTSQLYSIFEGDGRKLAINARPSFWVSDIVPLGVSKSTSTAEDFTISITEKEGIFNTSAVNVYLHDKVLGIYFDLASGDYTFTDSTTSLNNRFEIVYLNPTLSNAEFTDYNVDANIHNEVLSLQSSVGMTNLEVFDIMGRRLFENKIEGTNSFHIPFVYPQAVYIVKIKLENGKTAGIKLINEK